MNLAYYLLLLYFLVIPLSSKATDTPFVIHQKKNVHEISSTCTHCIYSFKDTQGLTIEEVVGESQPVKWSAQVSRDFFEDENAYYWMKFTVKNNSEVFQQWKTYVGWFNFGEVYVMDRNNALLKKSLIGQYVKNSEKEEIRGRVPVLNLELPTGEEKTVYVKAWNINKVKVSFFVALVDSSHWYSLLNERYWIGGIFFGVLLIMFLYNVFLFLMSKDKIYLYYSLYILNVSAYFFVFNGFSREYILGNLPIAEPYVWTIALGLAPMFYFQFMSAYAHSESSLPKLHPYIKGTVYLSLIATMVGVLILLFSFDVYLTGKIMLSILAVEAVFGLIVLYALFRKGSRLNYYLIIGSLILWFTGLTGLYFGYMDDFGLGLRVASEGVLIEILVFSMGLSHRMRLQRKDKELAQRALILQLRENGLIQKEANQQLELKVQERTQELALKNEELEQKNIQLNTLSEDKSHLISIVAHDLRNPLTSALSLSQMLQDDGEGMDEDQKECAKHISAALGRMNTMIQQILDVRAAEKQMLNMKLEGVNSNEILQEVSARFAPSAKDKNIILNVDSEEQVIKADRNLLIQIVENLLSNAIKFSPPHAQVNICNYCTSGKGRIEVEDEGPGLTEEDHKKLFKKFQKLSAKPTAGENSTGLGLSIVQRFTQEMGGKVWCESEVGEGAVFIVEFPLVEDTQVI